MRLRAGVLLLLLVLPLSRRGSKRANRPSEEIEVTEVEDVEGLKMCAHGWKSYPRLYSETSRQHPRAHVPRRGRWIQVGTRQGVGNLFTGRTFLNTLDCCVISSFFAVSPKIEGNVKSHILRRDIYLYIYLNNWNMQIRTAYPSSYL